MDEKNELHEEADQAPDASGVCIYCSLLRVQIESHLKAATCALDEENLLSSSRRAEVQETKQKLSG